MPSVIHFGTDGWRATIAETYTFDNVRIAAQGAADYFLSSDGLGRYACGYGLANRDDAILAIEYSQAFGRQCGRHGISIRPVRLPAKASSNPCG